MRSSKIIFYIALAAFAFLFFSFLKLPSSMYFEFGTRQIGLTALLIALILHAYTLYQPKIQIMLSSALFYFLSSLISPLIGMLLTALALITTRKMFTSELAEQKKKFSKKL